MRPLLPVVGVVSDVQNVLREVPLVLSSSSGVDRREFLAHGALMTLGALVVAACGTGADASTGPGSVNVTVNLADYPALSTVGGIAKLNGTSSPVAVVRASASSYRAFSLLCPHQGTTVQINGAAFRCPNHLATFNSTGQWTGGQSTSSLREFTVAVNGEAGTITVT